jgi:chitodextrinase
MVTAIPTQPPRLANVSTPRRLGRVAVAGIMASMLMVVRPPAPAAAATCQATTQTAYVVTICITAPAPGASVTGDAQTTATVTVTGTDPGLQRVVFGLDGGYLLTDFTAPYTFLLPSAMWVDGSHQITASAYLRDGTTSSAASIGLTFANGVRKPPKPPSDFAAKSTSAQHPVVAAAGDGPDGGTASAQVASLIQSWDPDLALYLGDVYEDGSAAEFYNWYGLTGWGALGPITNPVVGNHEYTAGQAPGYFGYWHNPPHYYAFTAGSWHVIALDSTSQFNQTAPGTAQYTWLQNQLANNYAPCTMVYFHHPVWSVGPQGDTSFLQDIWKLMANSGVDLVLTGHDHSYQRWVPLDANGNPASQGITQFVVGTAGHGIQGFVRSDSRLAVGYDTSPAGFGALKLTLNPSGASYVFADTSDASKDGGAFQCSGTPADTTAPSQVTDLSAQAPLGGYVTLSWTPAVDNVGVTGYQVFRNGTLLTTTLDAKYRDTTVTAGASYSYQVIALDPAGNLSAPSNIASVDVPNDGGVFFADGFESGDLASWSASGAFTVDPAAAFAGTYGADEVANGTPASATHTLIDPQTDLYYRVRFKIVSQDTQTAYLMRLRTAGSASLLGVYVSGTGRLAYRNDNAGQGTQSSTTVTLGVWHELQVHAVVAGANGSVQVWLDGTSVAGLTNTEDLGTTAVGILQVGDNAPNKTHEVYYDDVAASQSFISDTPPDTTPPTAPGSLTATATGYSSIDLSWTAATDNIGVVGYDISRDGSPLISVDGSTTSYTDSGLSGSTTYSYTVVARDAAGNLSAPAGPASATTDPAPTSGTFTFTPAADSYVSASKSTTNYGTATSLRIDASPQQVSYLTFDLSGVVGNVTSVTLRLYAEANGSQGCTVMPVADTGWGETTITWANAPTPGGAVASCSSFTSGSWVDVDLSGANLVSGDGTLSLAISDPSSTATRFSSREGTNPPQLVVVTS